MKKNPEEDDINNVPDLDQIFQNMENNYSVNAGNEEIYPMSFFVKLIVSDILKCLIPQQREHICLTSGKKNIKIGGITNVPVCQNKLYTHQRTWEKSQSEQLFPVYLSDIQAIYENIWIDLIARGF